MRTPMKRTLLREREIRSGVLNHIATVGGIEVIQDVTFGQGGGRPL